MTVIETEASHRIERSIHIAVSAKDMTRDDYEAIRDTTYPDGHAHLDALINDVVANPDTGR